MKIIEGYRDLRLLCKLYFRDSQYSEYASGSQYTKKWNVSGILNMLEFHRVY